eukprot:COSAG02_NODE_644_length_18993_cov_6.626389_23_plen_37_part_00
MEVVAILTQMEQSETAAATRPLCRRLALGIVHFMML